MNKFSNSFLRVSVLLALMIGACAVVFPGTARAASTAAGTITVTGSAATDYSAYQVLSATVTDGDDSLASASSDASSKIATDIDWSNAAVRDAVLPVLHKAGLDSKATSAQEAAEWLDGKGHMTNSLAMKLARAVRGAGIDATALTANAPATLASGYWLIVADDVAIGESQTGTAPIFTLVGGSATTVASKAATPRVEKHVLEDSTGAWQKAADATVADDLYWRLSATVPAGLTSYGTYRVQFVDSMSAGLDASRVAASAHVYVAAGTSGGFDAVPVRGGAATTAPVAGWTDITSGCIVDVDASANTFTVRTGDLVAALGGSDAFAAGARVVVVYDAPLGTQANHGVEKGNPNEVYLRYPRSPFADQTGDAGFTRTPKDDATAYTWDFALTKRGSADDKPLAGAKLRITDDRGRALTTDGAWQADGKASVITGADGRVTVSGVDSGKIVVEELEAPTGFRRMDGTRTVTVTVEGLDVKQVAAASPKLTVTAESPLRADASDAQAGTVEASLINTPATPPTPGDIIRGLMPATGDSSLVVVALLAFAAVVTFVAAALIKRGGGSDES